MCSRSGNAYIDQHVFLKIHVLNSCRYKKQKETHWENNVREKNKKMKNIMQ